MQQYWLAGESKWERSGFVIELRQFTILPSGRFTLKRLLTRFGRAVRVAHACLSTSQSQRKSSLGFLAVLSASIPIIARKDAMQCEEREVNLCDGAEYV